MYKNNECKLIKYSGPVLFWKILPEMVRSNLAHLLLV